VTYGTLLDYSTTIRRDDHHTPERKRPRVPASSKLKFLWPGSLFERLLQLLRLPTTMTGDIKVLRHDPLGMFLYNQRAVLFAAATLFLSAISLSGVFQPLSRSEQTVVLTLWLAWLTGVLYTVALHGRLRRSLRAWMAEQPPKPLPPVFDLYFLLDSTLITILIIYGRLEAIQLDALGFLLVAAVTSYAAYAFGRAEVTRYGFFFVVFIGIAATTFLSGWRQAIDPHGWLGLAFQAIPLVAITIVTVSVTTVAWLRRREQADVVDRLAALRVYASILATTTPDPDQKTGTHFDRFFRHQARRVLDDLCDKRLHGFWYRSACLWMAVGHHDRGTVFVPIAWANAPEFRDFRQGVDASGDFSNFNDLRVVPSL